MRSDTYELPTTRPNPGKTIFLLGMSEDGPVNAPVPVTNVQEAVNTFGSIDIGDLVRGYDQACRVSGVTIYLMRISGDYARSVLLGDVEGTVVPVLKFRSSYGGERYNLVYTTITEVTTGNTTQHILNVILDDIDMDSRGYILENYQTIDELMRAINFDTRHKLNKVWVTSDYAHVSPLTMIGQNADMVYLTGGDSGLGLSKDDIYIALETSYEILEGREIDMICPMSARFDDAHPSFFLQQTYADGLTYGSEIYYVDTTQEYLSLVDTENNGSFVTFHKQLVDFCKTQREFGFATHGILGMRERDLTKPYNSGYIWRLTRATALGSRYGLIEKGGNGVRDYGHFISVFAHDLIFTRHVPVEDVYGVEEETEYTQNGCAMYAAILASLRPDATSTNKPIPKDVTLPYEYEPDEISDLATLGVVVIRNSVSKGLVVAGGVTAALPTSIFHNVANVRIVQNILQRINQSMDNLVGESYIPVITPQEIQKRINAVMTTARNTDKYIRSYTAPTVTYNQNTGTAIIEASFVPKYTVESVSARATIRLGR